jgi:hypothetical protein
MKDIIGQSKPLFLILTILLPKKRMTKAIFLAMKKRFKKNPVRMMRAQIGLARELSFKDSRLNRQVAM